MLHKINAPHRLLWCGAMLIMAISTQPVFAHGSSVHYDTIFMMRQDDSNEKACLAGTPADADDVRSAKEHIEKTMDSYFALTPDSSPDAIRALFADEKGSAWKLDGAIMPVTEIAPKLQSPPLRRTLVAAVVGGDAHTARAIWAVTPASGSATAYYAGDFVNGGWIGGWKIWHLAIFPETKKPDVPSAYCHFDPDQAF